MKIIFSIFILFGFAIATSADEKCVFDHILVTLPSRDYIEFKNFLSFEKIQRLTGIEWKKDPSNDKGFAMFEDGSYLEVWDESRVNFWGYQEACRVKERSTLEKYGLEYKSKLGEFKNLAVVGRNGWAGDTQGGMFFIWQPKHVIDKNKDGIRQLLKLVKQNDSGEINSDLISDYNRSGLELKSLDKKKVMIATDSVGMKRVSVAVPTIFINGLVALRFSRKSKIKDTLIIQTDITGSPTMFLDLEAKVGTLVLRGDQYQKNSNLFGKNKL